MRSVRSACWSRWSSSSTYRRSCWSCSGCWSASTAWCAAGACGRRNEWVRGRTVIPLANTRVFGLDFLRALAILLVLVAHASFMFLPLTHRLEAWWMLGHLGVELFFVLSGFLIGSILARQAEEVQFSVGRFWARRWLRTLPNYYLFLAINIVLARWTEGTWPHAAPYA